MKERERNIQHKTSAKVCSIIWIRALDGKRESLTRFRKCMRIESRLPKSQLRQGACKTSCPRGTRNVFNIVYSLAYAPARWRAVMRGFRMHMQRHLNRFQPSVMKEKSGPISSNFSKAVRISIESLANQEPGSQHS